MAVSQLLTVLKKLNIINELPQSEIFLGRDEGEIRVLSQLGLIDQKSALTKLAEFLNLKLVDLDEVDTFDVAECAHALTNLDHAILWKYRFLPLADDGKVLRVAVSDPFNLEGKQLLQFASGKSISMVLSAEEQILRCLNRVSSRQSMPIENLEDLAVVNPLEVIKGVQEDSDINSAGPETPPIIRLSHKILADAIDNRASDIHLDPSQDALSVRVRVDGVMHLLFDLPKRVQPHIVSRFKLLAGMDISERRRPQDGRFSVSYGKSPVDVRSSTVPTPFGEKIVMRVLVSDLTKLSFSQLGAAAEMQHNLLKILEKRGKMLLVTGPTGSGKTTTLYTCLNYMRDGTHNIITVEDPIEYRIPGINQIQVNEAIGMTFAKTLRSILRQDPDVILVGEIRDADTARIAFQAAQTGHLVLSTLHTNDAPSALARLLGIGLDEYTIASSLEGVLAQRLTRKICSHCIDTPDHTWIDRFAEYLEAYQIPREMLRYGKGCNHCRGVGLSGQMGVLSYLTISEAVAEKIRQKGSIQEIVAQARNDGFRTIEEESVRLVSEGLTTLEEVKPYLESGEFLTHWRDQKRTSSVVSAMTHPIESRVIETSVAHPATSFEKSRILLIEDDSDMREILTMVLQREMYEVIEAENGQQGLELLFEKKPSVVICDLMMPQMDGREFLKRVRANPGSRSVPIIILTAVDSDDNEVDLLDLGATDFVSKTDATNVMLSRVRNAVSGKAK
jgi:type II secretory ATPase GspE/PulE/Tfp pilus assembly ATPase PilB-like protein/CheY-like chemotaxis protein